MAPQAKSTGIITTPFTLINDFFQRHQVFTVIASIVMVFGVAFAVSKPNSPNSIGAGKVADHSTLEGIRSLITGDPIKPTTPKLVASTVPVAVQESAKPTKPAVKTGSNDMRTPRHIVSGAGTKKTDGAYVDIGVPNPRTYPQWVGTAGRDGVHYYKYADRYLSNHGGVTGTWALGDTDPNGSNGLYFCAADGTVNPPLTRWSVSTGTGPAPIVTLIGGVSSTYAISGAGTKKADGAYVDQGVDTGTITGGGGSGAHWYVLISDGNPFYLAFHSGSWTIVDDYGLGTIYWAPDNGSITVPHGGWSVASGAAPAPSATFKKLAPAKAGASNKLASHKK